MKVYNKYHKTKILMYPYPSLFPEDKYILLNNVMISADFIPIYVSSIYLWDGLYTSPF